MVTVYFFLWCYVIRITIRNIHLLLPRWCKSCVKHGTAGNISVIGLGFSLVSCFFCLFFFAMAHVKQSKEDKMFIIIFRGYFTGDEQTERFSTGTITVLFELGYI